MKLKHKQNLNCHKFNDNADRSHQFFNVLQYISLDSFQLEGENYSWPAKEQPHQLDKQQ